MNQTSAEKLSELLADGLEMGWMRPRTDSELRKFIEARDAAIGYVALL